MNEVVVCVGCAVAAAAAFLPLRRAVFLAAIVVAALAWAGWAGAGAGLSRPLAAAFVFILVLLIRRLAEARRAAQRALEAEAAARVAAGAIAAGRERERIARDLHDSVTHLLTSQLLVLHTADAALSDGDADVAQARLQQALELCRRGLVEARDVVQVLAGASPDISLVRATVEDWRAATGQSIVVDAPDSPLPLDGASWAALLAALRESLTNISRHAPGARVSVLLQMSETAVALTVEDDGAVMPALVPADAGPPGTVRRLPGAGGTGLQGLRERAAIANGTLTAGPSGPGWRVHLVLPANPRSPARPESRFVSS
jgi:signal transduction histidine kinase